PFTSQNTIDAVVLSRPLPRLRQDSAICAGRLQSWNAQHQSPQSGVCPDVGAYDYIVKRKTGNPRRLHSLLHIVANGMLGNHCPVSNQRQKPSYIQRRLRTEMVRVHASPPPRRSTLTL